MHLSKVQSVHSWLKYFVTGRPVKSFRSLQSANSRWESVCGNDHFYYRCALQAQTVLLRLSDMETDNSIVRNTTSIRFDTIYNEFAVYRFLQCKLISSGKNQWNEYETVSWKCFHWKSRNTYSSIIGGMLLLLIVSETFLLICLENNKALNEWTNERTTETSFRRSAARTTIVPIGLPLWSSQEVSKPDYVTLGAATFYVR